MKQGCQKVKVILFLVYLNFLFLTVPSYGICEDDSAGQHVKMFYQQYIQCANNLSIDSDLSKYVDLCVLKTVRILNARGYFQNDYYTKSQDCWDAWEDAFVVHKEMKVDDTVSIVPISFKFKSPAQLSLLVFVRKMNSCWRIIKVAKAEGFYE